MKKIGIVIMAILVLVVLTSGCTSSNNNTTSSNVTVQINSGSTWNGTLASNSGSQFVNGSTNATYNLGPSPGTVTISLQKTGSGGTLTAQLLQGANIIQTQSTSDDLGVVTLSHVF